jgi:hypothetical protein
MTTAAEIRNNASRATGDIPKKKLWFVEYAMFNVTYPLRSEPLHTLLHTTPAMVWLCNSFGTGYARLEPRGQRAARVGLAADRICRRSCDYCGDLHLAFLKRDRRPVGIACRQSAYFSQVYNSRIGLWLLEDDRH